VDLGKGRLHKREGVRQSVGRGEVRWRRSQSQGSQEARQSGEATRSWNVEDGRAEMAEAMIEVRKAGLTNVRRHNSTLEMFVCKNQNQFTVTDIDTIKLSTTL
jgi:hypothetical protein